MEPTENSSLIKIGSRVEREIRSRIQESKPGLITVATKGGGRHLETGRSYSGCATSFKAWPCRSHNHEALAGNPAGVFRAIGGTHEIEMRSCYRID